MRQRQTLNLVLAGALILAMAAATAPQAAADPNPEQGPGRGDVMAGRDVAEWSVRWWQWADSIPVRDFDADYPTGHPVLDETGALCGVGQEGPVWLLAGNFRSGTYTRNCTIPASKWLFFPLINWSCSTWEGVDNGCKDTLDEVREQVNGFFDTFDTSTLGAEVDGDPVPFYRAGSWTKPPSWVWIPNKDWVFSLPEFGEAAPKVGWQYNNIEDGFYSMVEPLSPGQHVVRFHAEGFLDITYNLTVK